MVRVISSSIGAFLLILTIPSADFVQAGELQDAVKANDVPRIEALLAAGSDINSSDRFGTALHMAAARGSLQMADLLIAKGADLEAEAPAGQRNDHPLHTAARANQAAMVELLVKRGAKIDERNGDGYTALIIAARNGFLDVAQTLVNGGADPSATDSKMDYAPIHYASFDGRLDVVKYVLSKGVDVNLQSANNGKTPLSLATQEGWMEVVEYLLANGADPNIADKSGKTPAQMLSSSSVPAIREIILKSAKK